MFLLFFALAALRPAPDPLAADLVRAMQVHEQSIRSLHWTQSNLRAVPGHGDAETRNEQYADNRGRWTYTSTQKLFDPQTQSFMDWNTRGTFDGIRYTVTALDHKSSTIDSYRGERKGQLSIEYWLGRHLDAPSHRTIAEILLASPDLALAGTSERGLPIVSGSATLRKYLAFIEVEIDPEHGFAPRTITLRDRAVRVPYNRYQVVSFTNRDGIWIPEEGIDDSRTYAPTPEQSRRLNSALSQYGVSPADDVNDPRVQAAYASALMDAFNAREAPSQSLTVPTRVRASYISVNAPLPAEVFTPVLPPEYDLFDFFTNRMRPAGSDQWNASGAKP